jgi:hypothetical protein
MHKQLRNNAESHLANAVSQRLCGSLTPFVFGSDVFLRQVNAGCYLASLSKVSLTSLSAF